MPDIVSGAGPDGPSHVQDLLAMICAVITGITCVFTLVLYAHYRHLHSAANHLMMLALASLGLLSGVIFLGIFGFGQSSDARFNRHNCKATAVLHAWFLQVAHLGVAAHWWILAALVQWRVALPTNIGPLVLGAVVSVVSVLIACLSLAQEDQISQNGQSWCDSHAPWLVWIFQAGSIFLGVVGMLVAVASPLRHSAVNGDQKGLILRRLALSILWIVLAVIDVIATSVGYEHGRGIKTLQAALLPLSGALLCVIFLLPERMLTVRALGLPPGVDPPYGFTSTMKVVPDKICRGESYHQPGDENRRDPFAFHNIDLEATPLVSPSGRR